mgnify:CR=1 FL=1
MRVAGRGLDLEDALLDGEQAHVEGAAAEVEDEHVHLPVVIGVLLVLETVGDGRRGRLVDDVNHLPPRDLPGIPGGPTMEFVEVVRHGDHGPANGSDPARGILPQPRENQRAEDFGGQVSISMSQCEPRIAHLPLDRLDDAIGGFLGNAGKRGADHDPVTVAQQNHTGSDVTAINILDEPEVALVIELGN